jgi:DNA-binding transcriptional LysR family regulator
VSRNPIAVIDNDSANSLNAEAFQERVSSLLVFSILAVVLHEAAHDQALTELRKGVRRLTGPIRIKVPTTLGFLRLNALVREFAELHPDIDMEVLLLDGPMNPAAEGIDIAITAFPASFDNVADEFLWSHRRSLFASSQYLSSYPRLDHPRQLEEHRCLVYQPTGPSWPFLSGNGVMTVTVPPRISSNDMSVLLEAAKTHLGIALLSNYVALPEIRSGSLVVPLPDFPVPDLWIKAMVPIDRLKVGTAASCLFYCDTERWSGGRPSRCRLYIWL